jgi:AraC family transcriptional regulator, regulatory protein of adaptative response / methylated-DNA-[protein]-cysteine methyltransferase
MPYSAVTTTRIFCREDCSARPRPDHVRHYDTPEAALADGFRPCLRCRPLGHGLVVAATLDTPLGPVLAAATDDGVCLLEFADRRMLPTQLKIVERRLGRIVPGRHAHLERLHRELQEYFAGLRREFSVPIVAPGSPFELAVWQELRHIPPGETRSYDGLAVRLGRPGSARAVGRANGVNRIAIVIPCHRVIGADGALTGYGGGLWRKQRLLDLERDAVASV